MSESMVPIAHKQQQIIVIKVGGSVLAELPDRFFKELLDLQKEGWFPVIVHGGGPSITKMLTRLGIESHFLNGLRVTDQQTLDVVQMVLNGKENTEIVNRIQKVGGRAIGLSGVDEQMIVAEPFDPQLGFVGKVKQVRTPMLEIFQAQQLIPVISPLGVDESGQVYNINADTVAQAIATHLKAKKIFMVSDIPGIYHNSSGEKRILHQLTPQDIDQLINTRQVTDGMIPKVEAAIECLEQGIDEVCIIDGREEGILAKLYDHQLVGTRILKAGVVS